MSISLRARWSKSLETRLVELYEGNRCLWDPLYLGQLKGSSRDAILKSIALQLGENITSEDVRYKIKYYRDYFNRENKKVVMSKSTALNPDEVYQPQWFLYSKLKFMEAQAPDYENDLGSNDSFNDQTADLEVEIDNDNASITVESPKIKSLNEDYSDSGLTPGSPIETHSQHQNYSAVSTSPVSLLKIKLQEKTHSNKRLKRSLADSPTEFSGSHDFSTKQVKTPSSTFGSYVGERLQAFDEEARNWAMFKISEVLYRASKGEFQLEY